MKIADRIREMFTSLTKRYGGRRSAYIPTSHVHNDVGDTGTRKGDKSRREKRQAWLRRTKRKRAIGFSRMIAKGFRLKPWRGAYYEAIPSAVERPRNKHKNRVRRAA